jgi:hypothetical protein
VRLEYLLSGVDKTTRCVKNDTNLLKKNPKDEAISGSAEKAGTDRFSVGG